MMVVVGCLVVLGAVLAGFTMAGGHMHALVHPSEFLTIGGASLGALIVMSPKKVLKDVVHGVIHTMKGSPFNGPMYREFLSLAYEMLRFGRLEGVLLLLKHIENPSESTIFQKYPRVLKHKHAVEFFCGGLAPFLEGTAKAEQLDLLLQADLKMLEEEHHAPISVVSKTADALPGFGIVAAVLGIVITMGAIDGPVEEVGHKVGAALVGTFLGILLSYGLFGPLAARMEFLGAAEMTFFKTMASIVMAQANADAPKMAIERACRGVPSDVRPTRAELDEMFKAVDAAA